MTDKVKLTDPKNYPKPMKREIPEKYDEFLCDGERVRYIGKFSGTGKPEEATHVYEIAASPYESRPGDYLPALLSQTGKKLPRIGVHPLIKEVLELMKKPEFLAEFIKALSCEIKEKIRPGELCGKCSECSRRIER